MPFYELLLICRVGEAQAMGTLLKQVSSTILQQGGIVVYELTLQVWLDQFPIWVTGLFLKTCNHKMVKNMG